MVRAATWTALLLLVALGAASCASGVPAPSVTPASAAATATLVLPNTPSLAPGGDSPTTLTPPPIPTSTPDPYAGLTIEDLRARTYGGGELAVEESLGSSEAFTRSLVTYPSDGLTIHGFMNVPHGDGPFPVVIVLHGYIDPAVYETLAYTTRYADALARAGYLTIHPNLRGYPPSDDGPNRFQVGMAEDVLNLLALVRAGAGGGGALSAADPTAIGLMGHSMGGGIALRVLTVDAGIRAAVLYASMSADERANYEQVRIWTDGARGAEELAVPDEHLRRISPATYLSDVRAAVSIHHSDADGTVPIAWSADLHERLAALGADVEYHVYHDTPHTFRGEADALFTERMVAFFGRTLHP